MKTPSTRHMIPRLLLVTLLLLGLTHVVSADIIATVTDTAGDPLEATVVVYRDNVEIARLQTSVDGGLRYEAQPGNYTIIVYADDPETPGIDYLPTEIHTRGDYNDSIVLGYGCTLNVEGDIKFVDTENIPLRTIYTVLGEDNRIYNASGFALVYSDKQYEKYIVPGLGVEEIILPADSIIDLNVSTNILVESKVVQRSFLVEDLATPGKGETITINTGKYIIPINQGLTRQALQNLENKLREMKTYGFYMAQQEAAYNTGVKDLEDADALFREQRYDEAFGILKKSYILLTHTDKDLSRMYFDARVSVYALIAFITAASLITGYLIVDKQLNQTLMDLAIQAMSLIFLYYAYPGSKTISAIHYAATSVIFFLVFLAVGKTVPGFFSKGSQVGRVHTRNLISPIFNIAKRSLRRRKLRFLLTFISITLLVMSFVTLTSFSEGYGLITNKQQEKPGWTGVYIKEEGWSQTEPTFLLVTEPELNWLMSQPEVDKISLKAENTPQYNPITLAEGQPILGILGASPEEHLFIDLEELMVDGEWPTTSGIAISESFSAETGLGVGDNLAVGLNEYRITGVISDKIFRKLKDLDGSPYAPSKWVNVNPEGETPTWILGEAEPNEVLVMTLEEAVKYPTVGVQRIAIKVNPEYSPSGFAERLALERGYQAWSNTEEGYMMFRLGNYFQGKGATLLIPWIIVVLNVVITMLNSLYERRKEIEILSSVGLNPAQVSSIFIAEATMTGLIAGGLGYLMGLGLYKALAILNIGLQVHQKVSAVWGFAAIGLALSSVVTGALAALRNSVVITPSLMRRWRLNREAGGFQEPWMVRIPIKLDESEINNYLEFVEKRLRALENHPTEITSSIKRVSETQIDFVYKSVHTSAGNFYTRNSIKVHRLDSGEYGATLMSLGDRTWVHTVGSLIRSISMEYSTS